jgi:AraC-like DNA-binding protein
MNFTYSTHEVSAGRRCEYWVDTVCRHLIPASAEFEHPAAFEGALSGRTLGSLMVSHMRSGTHTFRRSESIIRQRPHEDFVALLIQAGSATMAQGGREVSLAPGDVVLCDAARPFLNGLTVESSLQVRIPRAHLLSRFSGAEHMMAMQIGQGTAMPRVLLEMIDDFYQRPIDEKFSAAEARLASAFVDTLSATMEMQSTAGEVHVASRYEALFNRADRYVRAHLDDGGMTGTSIADALHVSNRTLTRVFAHRHTSVMHHVWKTRLEASFAILAERRVRQVWQAAYQCGFKNLTHFSRAFRKEFGVTPGSVLSGDSH